MKKKFQLLAMILVLAMVLALAACGDSGGGQSSAGGGNTGSNTPATSAPSSGGNAGTGTPAPVEPNTSGTYEIEKLVVSSRSDGGTLDPWARSGWGNAALGALIFQKLANIDADGTLYYEIMKSWDKVDDTHYTLTIWDNIYDSDGNNLTADDIIWCFDQYIAAGNQGGVNKFDHFEKVDDYTLTWVCPSPFTVGELEKNLSNCNILTQAAYEASGNDMTTKPVGTGPYKLDSYTPGSSVVLVADENFWMNKADGITLSKWDAQNVGTIDFQIIQDAASRAIALEMGTIDIADALDGADVAAFESNPGITPVQMPQDPPITFIFNCGDKSPFADVNLRKAVCYALDNAAIADAIAAPAVAVYGISPRMWDAPGEWKTGREYYDYDPDQAKELVASSGYNNETLILQYTSNTAHDGAAIMMKAQLAEIGVNVELLPLEESVRNIEKYDETKWDFRIETLGGGNYLTQVLKAFSSADASANIDGGRQLMMVVDDKMDEVWNALKADTNADTIAAWDQYFTFDQCYAYAIANYSEQTAASSTYNVVLGGTRSTIIPNATSLA